ncbi:LADA_0E10352g1_1 [Lachancea dasiensis]|uniref:protein-histidine N-methyltransferase n=1 Tax=Lachancea dasiensis TaxID=1072105 RepID=A0A1G4JE88_9SACH|nr:LADA_0E10352g1_1 [Lachancea dasiensis]
MAFQFGFSGQDLSDDELSDHRQCSQDSPGMIGEAEKPACNPLDSPNLQSSVFKQPAWEDLGAILESLVNVRISFEKILTPQCGIPLYRRELFDVKHQLMTEADDEASVHSSVELEILMGETNEDVRRNVYEGGLKSWECSIDLVDALSLSLSESIRSSTILELGCGTSLPTEYLFAQLLQNKGQRCNANIYLADYNESVLRLVSIPNLVLTWAVVTLSSQELTELQKHEDPNTPVAEGELLLTKALLRKFAQDISAKGVHLNLLSGAWGRDFCNILLPRLPETSSELLILSSETIYQPETLPVISEVILELLQSKPGARALVAAKDIYFGVGGSVIEFQNYIHDKIQSRSLNLVQQTSKIQAGLKRSIVSIHQKEQ